MVLVILFFFPRNTGKYGSAQYIIVTLHLLSFWFERQVNVCLMLHSMKRTMLDHDYSCSIALLITDYIIGLLIALLRTSLLNTSLRTTDYESMVNEMTSHSIRTMITTLKPTTSRVGQKYK